MAPDDPGETVYVVLAGAVRLFHRAPDGREVTVARLGRGRLFGITSLFGEARGAALWAEAATDAAIGLADGDDVRDLLRRHPGLMMRIVRLVVARLMDVEEQLDRLRAGCARARLAGLLARLARDADEAAAGGWRRLPRPPTHARIAHHIGASRETVTRQLRALAEAGLVVRQGRALLVDMAALEAEGDGLGR